MLPAPLPPGPAECLVSGQSPAIQPLNPLRPLPQPQTPGELEVAELFAFSRLEIISAGAAKAIN